MVQPVVVVSPSAAAGRADGQRRGARGTRPSSRASSTPRPRPRRLRRPGKLFDVGGASVSHFMLRQPLRKNESVLTWRSGVLGISAPYLMKYQKFSQIPPLVGTHDLGWSQAMVQGVISTLRSAAPRRDSSLARIRSVMRRGDIGHAAGFALRADAASP